MDNQLQGATALLHQNGQLVPTPQFLAFLEAQKQLQAAIDTAWATVKETMKQHNVTKMTGNWGTIQFVPAELLKADDPTALDAAVTKTVLDTKKAKDYRSLFGALPAGVTAKYITKFDRRIK